MYLKMSKAIWMIEILKCKIWSILTIDYKKKNEFNYIINLINFHYLKVSTIKIELLIMLNQQKNCGKLTIISYWLYKVGQQNLKKWKISKWMHPKLLIIKKMHWFQCGFGIWKCSMIWSLEIQWLQTFNNLIWCDTKMLN